MDSNFLLIMAGGIGSRFWPFSREEKPKQFHDILGEGKTLIQATLDRFSELVPNENVFIVANESYRDLILDQLPQLSDANLLLEPQGRNTAPCISYGAFKAIQKDPKANLIVCPSDHQISNEVEFIDSIKKSLSYSNENEALVTLGIRPSRPDTGYGYIHFDNANSSDFKDVIEFKEKPDLETAKEFVANGNYLWNAGIFIWRAGTFINELESHLPEMFRLFQDESGNLLEDESQAINRIYNRVENISVDYGILERSAKVVVLPSDFGWSDVGTWKSLHELASKDSELNNIKGEARLYNVSDSLIRVEDGNLIVAQGLEGYIIVQERGVTMICKKDDEQMVKKFVEDLKKEEGGKRFL